MSLLPAGLAIEDLIIIMSALTAFVSAFAVWSALLHRDPAAKRAEVMATQREALRKGLMAPRRKQDGKKNAPDMMKQVVEGLHLMKSSQAEKVAMNLARAGWRGNDHKVRYYFFKMVLPFAFGGAALFLIIGLNFGELEETGRLMATMGAVLLGFYFPEIVVKNAAQKRRETIRKGMPDALDLMVICAEAGLSLDATMVRVADEIESAAPEMADEYGLTSLELGFLQERAQALRNLAERCELPIMRAMVNTLMQSEKYGTPLAHSLRVLSKESRDERMMKAEEKAARLPALMTVPMILFILPPLFIVLLGPAILDVIDNFSSAF